MVPQPDDQDNIPPGLDIYAADWQQTPSSVQARILSLLKRRHETLVLAMHDVNLALEHADRIVVLEHGRKVIDEPSASLAANDLLRHFGGEP